MELEVQQRFERIEAILEAVSRSQAETDVRLKNYFEQSEVRFKQSEARFQKHEELFQQSEERFQKSEERFQKFEERFQKFEERFQKHEARTDKLEARFEKRMKGFEKLVEIGMKEMAQLRRAQRQTDEKINALIDAQQQTEISLRQFLNSMRKGGNGR